MFRGKLSFFIALACTWIALFVAAWFYSRQHPSSYWIMTAALPAFVAEAVFYLGTGFESTRHSLSRLRPVQVQGLLLWASALLPYLIFSFVAGTYAKNAFELLALLTGALSLWYVLLPRRLAYDFGFLVIAAAPVVLRVFPRIYISPEQHLRIDVLGHLMWIRLAVAAILISRQWQPGGFGFWPKASDWRAGFLWYLIGIAPIAGLALALRDVQFGVARGAWWQIAGLGVGWFFAGLWVIAFSEELLFRGVIERALLNQRISAVLAILIPAVLFGSAHLWFRHFPDWRRSCVAGLLGVACGTAYYRTNSVKAAMVTHSLALATLKMFFK